MSEKSLKKALLKKSSSPYPERKKRPRLKFAWNREQAVDYENCKQIDIFIQDVIEKAKEDYLNTYSQQNGQCMDEDTPEDEECSKSIRFHVDQRFTNSDHCCGQDDVSSNENISKRKTTGNNKGSSAQETVEMKELGKTSYNGERKPLIDKNSEHKCCSNRNICSRLLILLTCYQCRCLQEFFSDS
ncbi:unnamed protein product [Mytilus edulis]|uniref:Uncharacterized protein n=1 Tax=Mytilus edulis TaxID=6550 RepID=A0A8S3TMP5_MYTED|nr:unnamed protein product [Mytilus edulis]